MSGFVQSIAELPTWLQAVLVVGIGFFVVIPILVVLAAVVGAFVLNVGGDAGEVSQAPQVEFEFDHDTAADELTVMHAGGDTFDSVSVEVRVDGSAYDWAGSTPETVGPGDSTTVSGVSPGDTVTVVWLNDTGEAVVVAEYTVG